MLLFALFILGFGVCVEGQTTELVKNQTSDKIYNNTLAVVRRRGPLHLLWYSYRLKRNLNLCLMSQFLKNETNGARRTLETNGKDPEQRTKNNITISLIKNPDSPNLKIEDIGGGLHGKWNDEHDVSFSTKNCFVLEAVIAPRKKPYCVVWGSRDAKERCFWKAEQNCESGTKVNLAQCADEKKK
uniref:Putative secreted protein 94 n=1 Tax=Amblyomma cajennense TaxID=34607 RepID=A0A023FCY5_AMBCJ